MNKWSSHSYPISELRNWSIARCLEIQPGFQRRELWSLEARKMSEFISELLAGMLDEIQESREVEFTLDSQEVFQSLSNNIIEKLNNQSREWIEIKEDFCDRENFTLNEINEFIDVQNIPNYLSNEDEITLEKLNNNLELQKAEIQKSNIQNWFINCEKKLNDLSSFSETQCKDLLLSLDKHPDNFSDEDYNKLKDIKTSIESKIDEININVLYERIMKLSTNMKINYLNY